MRWFIYVLRDPISWDVRYVGKANDPALRLRRHIVDASRASYRNGRWVNSLLLRGLRPMLEVIDSGMGGGHVAAERAWIAEYRGGGADLTNTADGGIGGGGPCSEDVRRKISDAQRGKPRPPESIAKMAATKRGQKQSAETIAKRSAKLKGHAVSAETREKIATSKRGKPCRPDTIAKIAASLAGRRLSEETRAKLRASQQARRERERLNKIPETP